MDLGDRPRALLAKYLDLLLELLDYGVLLLGDVVSVPLEKFDLLLVLNSDIGFVLRTDVSLTYWFGFLLDDWHGGFQVLQACKGLRKMVQLWLSSLFKSNLLWFWVERALAFSYCVVVSLLVQEWLIFSILQKAIRGATATFTVWPILILKHCLGLFKRKQREILIEVYLHADNAVEFLHQIFLLSIPFLYLHPFDLWRNHFALFYQ